MCSKTQSAGALGVDRLAGLEPALARARPARRADLAHQLGADDVEARSSRRRRTKRSPSWPRHSGRTPAGSRKATTPSLGHHHGRVGALEPRHHLGDRVLDPPLAVEREQRGDDLRVGGGAERDPLLAQLVVELDRVGQVAVVGERDLAAVVAADRLGVLPGAAAGGRVADVADRHVAGRAPAASPRRRPGRPGPRSRRVVMWPPSQVAIPADSWPRCWSA